MIILLIYYYYIFAKIKLFEFRHYFFNFLSWSYTLFCLLTVCCIMYMFCACNHFGNFSHIHNNCSRKQQKLKIKWGLHSLILDCSLVWSRPWPYPWATNSKKKKKKKSSMFRLCSKLFLFQYVSVVEWWMNLKLFPWLFLIVNK